MRHNDVNNLRRDVTEGNLRFPSVRPRALRATLRRPPLYCRAARFSSSNRGCGRPVGRSRTAAGLGAARRARVAAAPGGARFRCFSCRFASLSCTRLPSMAHAADGARVAVDLCAVCPGPIPLAVLSAGWCRLPNESSRGSRLRFRRGPFVGMRLPSTSPDGPCERARLPSASPPCAWLRTVLPSASPRPGERARLRSRSPRRGCCWRSPSARRGCGARLPRESSRGCCDRPPRASPRG